MCCFRNRAREAGGEKPPYPPKGGVRYINVSQHGPLRGALWAMCCDIDIPDYTEEWEALLVLLGEIVDALKAIDTTLYRAHA